MVRWSARIDFPSTCFYSAAGDVGLVCLRAVATALLAIFDKATVAVLTYIIPRCLVNYDLEGEHIQTDGPFLACVLQFVEAVGSEEVCNTLRKELHRQLDEKHCMLFSSSRSAPLEDIPEIDVPVVIGFLDWLLSSPFKRAYEYYPTRSLSVWYVAVALEYVGFDVYPSPTLISSDSLYDRHMEGNRHPRPTVYLVTCHARPTDPLAVIPNRTAFVNSEGEFAARILPIKAIPRVIFRHICNGSSSNGIDIEGLCSIWNDCFDHAYSSFTPCQFTNIYLPERGFAVTILESQAQSAKLDKDEEQSDKILFHILAPILKKYMPGLRWTWQYLANILRDYCHFDLDIPQGKLDRSGMELDEWCIFSSIILSTMYAACCKSICSDSEEVTDKALIDVAIVPDLLSNARNRQQRVHIMISAFQNQIGLSHIAEDWIELVLSLFTGESQTTVTRHLRNEKVLGYHRNGIFLITDMVMRPSVRSESLLRLHVQWGQPIQFPVTETGHVVAIDKNDLPELSLHWADHPIATGLKSRRSDKKARIDAEPFWEGDPRRVVFRLRLDGVLACSLNPGSLVAAFSRGHDKQPPSHDVSCDCGTLTTEVSIPDGQRWRAFDVPDFVGLCKRSESPADSLIIAGDGHEDSLCVYAGQDIAVQIMCLVFFGTPVVFATKCLKCACDYANSHLEKRRENRIPGPRSPRSSIGVLLCDTIGLAS